jgi:NAD(P)-dependent dehydrogenase (short-subunit alcohol dehydrogenase family)
MNVVIVGGGTKGKFGNDLVNRLRSEGHDVYILSHRDNGTNDPKQVVADFKDMQSVIDAYEKLTNHLDTIDLFLYNSNGRSYLNNEHAFTSGAIFNNIEWQLSLNIAISIPYNLIIKALSKMNDTSKLIYMATGLATNYNRTEFTEYSGYAGSKAYMTHLMLGFANHNDKGSIVSILSPHFNYDDKDHYNNVFERICNYIQFLSKELNGKIVQFH